MARKYKQGVFIPNNPEKYIGDVANIVYRSGWEAKVFRFLDNNPFVVSWASEEIVIDYWSDIDQRMRRYFVDLCVTIKKPNGEEKTYLVEIKPYAQTIPPKKVGRKKMERYLEEVYTYEVNKAKWQAAEKWCKKNGIEFMILTEKELDLESKK